MSPVQDYSWTESPLVTCAPMRLIAGPKLAAATSEAGGLGFLGAGTDLSSLPKELEESASLLNGSSNEQVASYQQQTGYLPIGVGVICHKASLDELIAAITEHDRLPVAIWLFAANSTPDLTQWVRGIRDATKGKSPNIWIQIGGVEEAVQATRDCKPEVLVVQGIDAGGHGLQHGASIVSLLPEVADALQGAKSDGSIDKVPGLVAAGGISDGRGLAAAVVLGAAGISMGTRYLASEEAVLAKGYRDEVIRAGDGGQSTARSKVYDTLRGTTHWPDRYGGRGVVNAAFHDFNSGMDLEENKRMYQEAVKAGDCGWGPEGRMTTYAGTSVGLVKKVLPAASITKEVRDDCNRLLKSLA